MDDITNKNKSKTINNNPIGTSVIRIRDETKEILDNLKIIERDTYDNVLARLLAKTNEKRDNDEKDNRS